MARLLQQVSVGSPRSSIWIAIEADPDVIARMMEPAGVTAGCEADQPDIPSPSFIYHAGERVGPRQAAVAGAADDGETGRNVGREVDRDRPVPVIAAEESPTHG
jgi:hypothetical protein